MGTRFAHGRPATRAPAPRLGKSLSRVLAPAAFRVPRRTGTLAFPCLAPQIFVHEGVRRALMRRLLAAFPGPVLLSITDNRHSIVSHAVDSGVLHVSMHHMFLDAPPDVLDSLVLYVTRGDRAASVRVGQYIDEAASRIARRTRRSSLVTQGAHHDLYAILTELNAKYFDGAVTALITWGKRGRPRARPRTTIKLGSYSAAERLIRVHPALDRPWVPRYFVAYIVFHEMLHHVLPGWRSGAERRVLHPPSFHEREKEFRHFERAIHWERRNLGRLLRS